ncbi:MAG: DUF445 domain-containing protein [Leptospira sp.]|nr:DUF445 domain-containing protein [Leptospira sp.]
MDWITSPQAMQILSIPLTCAFVGWVTNYMAVKMIFHPMEFWGVGKIGWKGIIPNHAIKMSGLITRVLTEKLITPKELYNRINPDDLLLLVKDLIDRKAEEIVRDVIQAQNPALWKMLPASFRQSIEDEVRAVIPEQVRDVYDSFGKDLDNVLEFDEIVKNSLSGRNTVYLIEMFQRCGGPEFQFIIRSGAYFGFLIGLIQIAFINILGQWWTMPIMGIAVGYYTNWLALLMIFRPLEVKQYVFFKYQGLFLKRQKDVSKEFAAVVANRVLNTENLIRLIFMGKGGDLIIRLVNQKAQEVAQSKINEKIPMADIIMGQEKIQELKESISEKIVWIIPDVAHRVKSYVTDTLKIEETIAERLSKLPKEDFEELLHSVFKEDEMTLIVLGALLGGLVGMIQAYFVFFYS